MQSEIQNTGVGGCTFDNASMNVMVWDGHEPGFAWDWNQGMEKGNQPLDVELHDPDVVVSKGTDQYADTVFAHFVYESDHDFIYYEVWSYDPISNSWNQFVSPTQLSQGGPSTNPNIDRYKQGKIAVVWCEENQLIRGITGNIIGNYYGQPQTVYSPSSSQGSFVEPDLAMGYDQSSILDGISVTFKEIYDNSPVKKLWVATYDWSAFQESSIILDAILENTSDDEVQFGSPRIAADISTSHNPWPFQIVMVRQFATDRYFIKGYNNYSGNFNGFSIYGHIINQASYNSPFGSSTVNPVEHPTKEPVVSFLEDIHVAWSYIEPETETWEIIYTSLHETTGEPYKHENYSLVNGHDGYGYFDHNQHHPCIASRFNYDNEKFIGWLDDEEYHPEYKIRHTNEQIFGLEEKSDPSFLYPNPAHNFFRINLPNEEEIHLITVYSIDGRKALESTSANTNISGLQPGVYIVEIKSGQKTQTKRLVKQ